jgi:sterol desaturase/sphingolipid hydroxylase (fatty acid hydroxylase superfamily)
LRRIKKRNTRVSAAIRPGFDSCPAGARISAGRLPAGELRMNVLASRPPSQFVLAAQTVQHSFGKLFSRFHWTAVLSSALIVFLTWAARAREEEAVRSRGFRRFIFPREVWLHPSARLDYRFVLFDKVALGVLIGVGTLLVSPHHVERAVKGASWLGHAAARANWGIVLAYTVVLLFTEDFFRYWAHRWMHTSPFLWQFHKVHHSAEALIPFSELRSHPVNGIIDLTRGVIAVPLVTIIFLVVFPGRLTAVTILGVNAGRFIFNIGGAHLRHSHVWLSFGPFWEKLVISPAQHQIHHSRDVRHRNLNFGSQFAVWDWLFGTLYLTQKRPEAIEFGIDKADNDRLRTVARLYLVPFRDAWAVAHRTRAEAPVAPSRLDAKSL